MKPKLNFDDAPKPQGVSTMHKKVVKFFWNSYKEENTVVRSPSLLKADGHTRPILNFGVAQIF
jgi:hypothetical protein